ncbi:tyrosine-type recombinase/integrase [Vibrio diabolicus]|uniref:tyrosine-type recombinase/integrase n=1 Tax=Vibrio diabolicus TaxID=50719 RepID=UPI00215193DD|nr:tyrosine-type recombinase/integrase [Vibrio diabolicus]MCE3219227.1 tyrosine-type recombinase/integrase [Vibrio diabolicus]
MYLQKAPNGVYQTRICIPKLLREFGYPFDIKVSLLTKERSDAIERNFKTASCIKGALSLIDHNQPPLFSAFKATLDKRIEALRFSFTSTAGQSYSKIFEAPPELMEHFQNDIYTDLPSEVDLTNLEETDPDIKSVPTKVIPFSKLLERFLESKKKRNVRQLTVHQLNQRISHCINFLETQNVNRNTVCISDLEDYIDLLYSESRSSKTNKDYFSAVKQFFKWLKSKKYILENPTEDLNPKFKSQKHVSEQRDRWTDEELSQLIQSPEFVQASLDFQWISKLQLFHGLRTGEACQLYIQDIVLNTKIPHLKITDQSKDQHLKNEHAVRSVPLHPAILEDFVLFYKSRLHKGNVPLFNYPPLGKDKDWTKTYRTQFGKLQTKLGMPAGKRPTAYGLRHTFIDELKEQDIAEHCVAEIVGHTNPHMTFGRYGKKLKLEKLLEIVSTFKMKLEG